MVKSCKVSGSQVSRADFRLPKVPWGIARTHPRRAPEGEAWSRRRGLAEAWPNGSSLFFFLFFEFFWLLDLA